MSLQPRKHFFVHQATSNSAPPASTPFPDDHGMSTAQSRPSLHPTLPHVATLHERLMRIDPEAPQLAKYLAVSHGNVDTHRLAKAMPSTEGWIESLLNSFQAQKLGLKEWLLIESGLSEEESLDLRRLLYG